MLSMVCNVEIESVLQELTGESLPNGTNRAPDARLDIHVRGFWERQRPAFFDVRVCYPNAILTETWGTFLESPETFRVTYFSLYLQNEGVP